MLAQRFYRHLKKKGPNLSFEALVINQTKITQVLLSVPPKPAFFPCFMLARARLTWSWQHWRQQAATEPSTAEMAKLAKHTVKRETTARKTVVLNHTLSHASRWLVTVVLPSRLQPTT